MWFPNKNFLLKTYFENSDSNTIIEVYDQNFNLLCSESDTICIELPNKIVFRLINVEQSKITKMSLAGVNFNLDNLLQITEYKVCKYKLKSLQQLEKLQSLRSLECLKDGYFIFNFFNRNPFFIHLAIKNKINFKL